MNIQFIRNAAMIIMSGSHRIIVDPCLGPKGSLPPYTLFRRFPRLNPTVGLPDNIEPVLDEITAGLITHCRNGHFDHLDKTGIKLLSKKQIPVFCSHLDTNFLIKKNINAQSLYIDKENSFLGGRIIPFKTAHGTGIIGKLMGPGLGYFIELPDEPSIYIAGDTLLTPVVRNAIADMKPDIVVLYAGTPVLDIGRPIIMPMDELLECIRLSPGRVVATHMDSFNHCTTTRKKLRDAAKKAGVSEKVIIPEDGELIAL